jgi:hypothetical protein
MSGKNTVSILCKIFLLNFFICQPILADVYDEIIKESLWKRTPEQLDRPLPLIGHWNLGEKKGGYAPVYQFELIEKGKHLLPWFHIPRPQVVSSNFSYYEKAIKKAAQYKLPISFVGTQWEHLLSTEAEYYKLPKNRNPNVIDRNGSVKRVLSPYGPASLWYEVGKRWTSTSLMKKIQEWYPDPPLVIFVSNNEHDLQPAKDLSTPIWPFISDVQDKTRKDVGDRWVEKYRLLQRGMRDGFKADSWKKNSIFIGYNAFESPQFARYDGWLRDSLYTKGRFQPWPYAWDGSSVSYYVRPENVGADYVYWSPQVEAMNWVFMLEEVYRINPNYWFEISVWDGGEKKREFYKSKKQQYSPKRYKGMIQYGMWLLRPRVVREFRMWDETVSDTEEYFFAAVDSVESVYKSEVLKKFWRSGRLVPNSETLHPYRKNIPNEYSKVPRWFNLKSSVNNTFSSDQTEISVFSLALELGSRPNREWLIYSHVPVKNFSKPVTVKVPNYKDIKIMPSLDGSFYQVFENDGKINTVKVN